MGYIKPVTTLAGYSAEYWKLQPFRIDEEVREASFVFKLYQSRAACLAGAAPATTQVAKLRMTGDAFDAYFHRAVLAGLDVDIYAHIYTVARAMSAAPVEGAELTCDPDLGGSAVFADAEDELT